jgi:hypothetical protein
MEGARRNATERSCHKSKASFASPCVRGTIGIRLAQTFFSRLGVHPDPKILDDLVRRKEHGILASQNMFEGALAQVL